MQMDQFNVFLCVYVLSHSLLISCVCFSAYFEFQFAVCGHCPGTAKDRKPPPGERHRQARVERYEHFFWGGGVQVQRSEGSGSGVQPLWGLGFMGLWVRVLRLRALDPPGSMQHSIPASLLSPDTRNLSGIPQLGKAM